MEKDWSPKLKNYQNQISLRFNVLHFWRQVWPILHSVNSLFAESNTIHDTTLMPLCSFQGKGAYFPLNFTCVHLSVYSVCLVEHPRGISNLTCLKLGPQCPQTCSSFILPIFVGGKAKKLWHPFVLHSTSSQWANSVNCVFQMYPESTTSAFTPSLMIFHLDDNNSLLNSLSTFAFSQMILVAWVILLKHTSKYVIPLL